MNERLNYSMQNIMKNEKSQERYLVLDIVKTLAIIFVVWGHMIQYLHGSDYNYWEDIFFKWIYGFHMPIFALVSGFLYSKSKKRNPIESIQRKFKQLLVPVIEWGLFLTILDCCFNVITKEPVNIHFIIVRFIARCVNDLWFLKGIFICFILVLAIEQISQNKSVRYLLFIASSLMTLLLPKVYCIHLYGFLIPYYFIGYTLGTKDRNPDTMQRFLNTRVKSGLLSLLLFIIYCIVLCYFHKQHYIYTSGLSVLDSSYGVLEQLYIDIFRFVTGMIGCAMIISFSFLIKPLLSSHIMSRIVDVSGSTLVIYILTASIFVYLPQILKRLGLEQIGAFMSPYLINVCILLPLSLLMICVSIQFKTSKLGKLIFK